VVADEAEVEAEAMASEGVMEEVVVEGEDTEAELDEVVRRRYTQALEQPAYRRRTPRSPKSKTLSKPPPKTPSALQN
jgi:hypothetical protein